ncbi:hypothetical protein ACIO6T_45275 [Streptomyces sp. NPDC087532]|uniref:hypothetical protein n=1 Tax=Streptomyces sp. NPDC087532 TaxID=3365795 RepID=UPI00380307D0
MPPTAPDVAALLATPEQARQILAQLPLEALDALADAIPAAAQKALAAGLVERVRAFLDGTDSTQHNKVAYFTPTEEHGEATWSPFIDALSPSEGPAIPGHTVTNIQALTTAEAHLADELTDPDPRNTLRRLAEFDPPDDQDVLRVDLRTGEVDHLRKGPGSP